MFGLRVQPRHAVSVAVALVAAVPYAYADGATTGRAGAGTASSEYGAGQGNPAALARRSGSRIWLGTMAVRDAVQWQSEDPVLPRTTSLSSPRLAPNGGAVWAGATWLLAISAATTSSSEVQLPVPNSDATDATLLAQYPWRLQGISARWQRDEVAVAVTRRMSDAIAVGVALGVAHVALREQRHVATGTFEPISSLVSVRGQQWGAPSARFGMVVMPASLPFELGLAVWWNRGAELTGTLTSADGTGAAASWTLPQELGATASIRRVANRWTLELDGEITSANPGLRRWLVPGGGPIRAIDSRLQRGLRGEVRLAGDYAVIPGLLWLTAGVGVRRGTSADQPVTPLFSDFSSVLVSAGAVVATDGVAVMFGGTSTHAAQQATMVAGVPAAITSSRTMVGLTVEYEFGGL